MGHSRQIPWCSFFAFFVTKKRLQDTCVWQTMWNHAKKLNGRVQTFRFSVFTMGRQELRAENAKKTPKLEELKRKFLKFWKRYDLYRVLPRESWRPQDSENIVVFEFWKFLTKVIGRQCWVKIEERERRCSKKRHGHNFEFWALSRNQRGTNHIGPTLIPYQSPKLNIADVTFFWTPPSHRILSSIFTKL